MMERGGAAGWTVVAAAGALVLASAAWSAEAVGQGREEVVQKAYGEVGLGFENLTVLDASASDGEKIETLRNRPEVRFRLGVELALVKDRVWGEVGLRGGETDSPTEVWGPAAEFGRLVDVALERAWIGGSLDGLPEVMGQIGRFEVPWRKTGLIWDEDVALPGLLVRYDRKGSSRAVWRRATASAAGLYLGTGEPEGAEDEISMWVGQVGAVLGLSRTWELEWDLGYTDLVGRRKLGQAIASGEVRVGSQKLGFTTNTTDTDVLTPSAEPTQRLAVDGLGSDFNVLSLYTALSWVGSEVFPVKVFTQAAWNLGTRAAGEDHALGLVTGVQLGELGEPGTAELTIQWLYIEADAVLALYNEDIWLTNVTGVEVDADFEAYTGLRVGFEALYTEQADAVLRGFGDDRGEPQSDDPGALRVRVFTEWVY